MNQDNQTTIDNLHRSVAAARDQLPVQVDLVRDLQVQIFGFVGKHLDKIARVYALRDKVQQRIENNIDANQYSPDALVSLYRMLTQENAAGTDMIVGLFRPAPGVESFLARNLSEDHLEKDKNKAASDLVAAASPEMLRKIDLLSRYLESTVIDAAKNPPTPVTPTSPPAWPDQEEEVT